MKEIDRLKQIHANDPPPTRVGQCKRCGAHARLVDGRMPPHAYLSTGNPCACRVPAEPKVEEYTVGYDTMYGVYYGGAWELGEAMSESNEPHVYVIEDRVSGEQAVTVDDPEVAKQVAEGMVQDYYGRPVKWDERSGGELCGTYYESSHSRTTIYCYRFPVKAGPDDDSWLELGKSEGHNDG